MLFAPILGLIVLFAGVYLRRSFQYPDKPNLERLLDMAGLGAMLGGLLIFAVTTFNGMYFYAEPGYKYHVRTILGEEKMVSDTGYNTYLFGRYNAWKNAMSV